MHDPQEYDQYITPDGDTVALTLRGAQYRLTTSNDSLPASMLDYGAMKGPLQDGDTVTYLRLSERIVQMNIANQECKREDYWHRRATLLNTFRPNRWEDGPYIRPLPGTLRRYLPNGDYRDLFVFCAGCDFGSPPPDRGPAPTWPLDASITWKAADPLWYGPPVLGAYVLEGVGGLRFPAAFMAPIAVGPGPAINEWVFGGGYAAAALQLVNLGTWHTFPVITLAGPLTYVSIANITTDEVISFTGSVPPGLELSIDLTYGQKRAYDDGGTDYSGYLDGDVGEFHIACDPEAPGGINQIQIILSGGGPGALAAVSFRSPYVGI